MIAFTAQDVDLIEAALKAPTGDGSVTAQALAAIDRVRGFIASPELLDEAQQLASRIEDEEDRISFDGDASISPSDEGTFVSCWFWVPNSTSDEDE
jgi:hypothetical protein